MPVADRTQALDNHYDVMEPPARVCLPSEETVVEL